MTDTTSNGRPFYREPMVWMLIGIPASAVIMGVVMITLAVRTNDGLVVDDYYKKGLEINRTLERDARASALGLNAFVRFMPGDNRVSLSLEGAVAFVPPEEIRLGFYHATRKDEDRVLSMRRDAGGTYTAPMPALAEGRWYISAATEDWRLTRVMHFPVDNPLAIRHQPSPGAGGDGPGA